MDILFKITEFMLAGMAGFLILFCYVIYADAVKERFRNRQKYGKNN